MVLTLNALQYYFELFDFYGLIIFIWIKVIEEI